MPKQKSAVSCTKKGVKQLEKLAKHKNVKALVCKGKSCTKLYNLKIPSHSTPIDLIRSILSVDKLTDDFGFTLEQDSVARVNIIKNSEDLYQYTVKGKLYLISTLVRVAEVDDPRYQYTIEVQLPSVRPYKIDTYRIFFNEKIFSDVTLTVGDRKLHAHKALLSRKSPVFKGMFDQGKNSSCCFVLEIKDVDYSTMFDAVYFMYNGKVMDDYTSRHVHEIYSSLLMADTKYCIEGLKGLCEEKLCLSLTTGNVLETLILADCSNARDLKEKAIGVICKNIKEIMETPSYDKFFELHPRLLIDILQAVVVEQQNAE